MVLGKSFLLRFQDVELTFWTPPLTPCILGDSFTANPLTADHRESDFSEQASRGTAVMSVKPFNAEQVAVEVPIAAAAAPARNTQLSACTARRRYA